MCLVKANYFTESASLIKKLIVVLFFVHRGKFNEIHDDDISFFQTVVGAQHVITDYSDLEMHNVDWMRSIRGQSKVCLPALGVFCCF